MATLKLVMVLITAFTRIKDGPKMRDYLGNCLSFGSASTLFGNPNITTAFYGLGTSAYNALVLAINNYVANDTEENLKIVKAKMALAVIWLRSYASQVQVIANLPANCTTREEAAINIGASFLTAQKLSSTEKGNPEIPVLTGENEGIGKIGVTVTNSGVSFIPSSIHFIAVSLLTTPVTDPPTAPAADPVVTLLSGQISLVSSVAVQVVTLSLTGKGREITFFGLTPGTRYAIYAYTKNGNKQVSQLSLVIIVQA